MLWRIIVRYIKPYWPLLVGVLTFQLLQSVASLLLPTLNADIIDIGVVNADTGYILSVGALMLGISLVQILASITAVYFGARMAMSLGRDLRDDIFTKVNDFSAKELNEFGAPSLITRNTNDVQQVQMLVLMSLTMMVSAPILAIGGVVMALQQDLELSWLMTVSIPVLLISVGFIIVRMIPLFRKLQKQIDRINQVLREQLTGIRVIRAFVREGEETQRFKKANEEVTDTALRVGRLMALMFPVVMLVMNLSSVAVIWYGGFRVEEGAMQVGTVMAFLQYLMQILMGVMMSTMMVMMVPRAAVSAERIGEVLETVPSVMPPNPDVLVAQPSHPGQIIFDNVSFAYPGADKPVLENISFTAEPGTTTAIIGSTGSGKSTLIGLIPRLFKPTAGRVLAGGVDVEQLDPDTLWNMLGLVPQKPYLFAGTIASNLRYGKPDATEEEMWAALDIAQARDFVSKLPDQLEAPIAQGGTNVSGGQRQRISIARALIKNPDIYIFDDSFSALDLTTDALLRRALNRSRKDATQVVIAQRVSSIVNADQILVIDHGQIVGKGTHQYLSETNPTYQEIVESQATAEEAA